MFKLINLLLLLILPLISSASSSVICSVQAKITDVLLPNLDRLDSYFYRLDPSFKKPVIENAPYLIPLSVIIQTSIERDGHDASCPEVNARKTILATVPCEAYLSQLKMGSVLNIRYLYNSSPYPKFYPEKNSWGSTFVENSVWEVIEVINE